MNFAYAMALAGLTGFISLSYEMLFYRTVSVATGGSALAFPMLLGAFLFGIAFGARVSEDLCHEGATSSMKPLRAIGWFIVGSNICAFVASPAIAWVVGADHHVGLSLPFVVLASGLLGAQFPLITHYAVQPDDRAGQRVSFLYFANILGSTSGSLITATIVLDYLTLMQTSVVLCLIGVVSGAALIALTRPSTTYTIATVAFAIVMCAAVVMTRDLLFDRFWDRIIFANQATVAEIVENKHGVIVVDEDGGVYGGGIYDGIFSWSLIGPNHVERAYALPLFHSNPRRVLMVGLSSGSWVKILANAPGVEEVVVIEINPGYLELLDAPDRDMVLKSDKVKIIIDDGRRWLMRNPHEKFDAVVSNHSFHWRNLASNLLSVEYNNLLKSHMNPGGVYIFNTTGEPRVFRTAMMTWSHVVRFQSAAVAMDFEPTLDLEKWEQQLTDWRIFGRPAYTFDNMTQAEAARRVVAFIFENDPTGATRDTDLFEDAWEPEDELRKRVEHELPITDDNMGTEWSAFRL